MESSDEELLSLDEDSDNDYCMPNAKSNPVGTQRLQLKSPSRKETFTRNLNKSSGSATIAATVNDLLVCSLNAHSGQATDTGRNASRAKAGNIDADNVSLDSDIDNEILTGPGSSGQTSRVQGLEITLSDDEDEQSSPQNGQSSNSEPRGDDDEGASASTSYRLRRKRKINYEEIENGTELGDEHESSKDKSKMKKDILDVFGLSDSKLEKCIRNPDLIDNFIKCKIAFMHGTNSSRFSARVKFFQKCGQQFQNLFIQIRANEESYSFLKSVFKCTSCLSRLDYRYQNQEDAYQLLKLLSEVSNSNGLSSLTSLKLISTSGTECLRLRHLTLLAELPFRFQSLELGDAIWEDVKAGTMEKFLGKQKLSLATLIINGGFRGDTDKEKILISFPKMEVLKTLYICPKYTFLSEFKNPYSKKARVINVDVFDHEEPYKIAVKFTSDLPNLKRLVLGNLIEIEDLVFSSVRKLTEFRCGSYWNLSIRFPGEGSRKSLIESSVTEFQFPDALKDPIFTVTVAKHFPNIKKVWLNLPSVPVLRAFFKAFDNSQVEELYLKTQFDFENIMESCLLPNMHDVLRKNPETEALLETLREYKHFDEYIRYYNVELPVEAEDLMEGHSAGIGALKNLKVLHLEHIPRQLLIPVPDDERKWYDHNCKFMSTTFGYKSYPLNRKCHQEILKLDLQEYIWKNIDISSRYTNDFYQAGFVDISDVYVLREVHNSSISDEEEEEDIFTPVLQKSSKKGPHVKVMPSMLLPSFKAKSEEV